MESPVYFVELKFVLINAEDYVKDLLIDALAGLDYDTFEETADGFLAYIHGDKFSEAATDEVLSEYKSDYQFSYSSRKIPYENWNQLWESNFQPVIISGKCFIRASFHEPRPDLPMDIVIDPKMAFGTGHHETTSLMSEYLFETPIAGKTVLDMGCGTAVLAIIASKLGAVDLIAIDNDAQAVVNAKECVELNGCTNIDTYTGDKSSFQNIPPMDIILANINRNILVDQLECYAQCLKTGGILLMSGFYAGSDLSIIKEHAATLGLNYINHKEKNNWVAAQFKK